MSSWKTKNGRILSVRDMSTDHIRNTMNMLRRKIEMRSIFFESIETNVDLNFLLLLTFPIYEEFQAELKRRGIDT